MRIIGVDYGEKRVGIARSDELGMLAHGVGYIENKSDDFVIAEMRRICDENAAGKIVVGMPRSMSGEKGNAAESVERFIALLKAAVSIPVETWDERFTTKIAYQHFSSGMSGKQKRQKVDQLAAQIMLQGYLDGARMQRPIDEPSDEGA